MHKTLLAKEFTRIFVGNLVLQVGIAEYMTSDMTVDKALDRIPGKMSVN